MKLIKWKVSDGARLLDCGSTWSESEREVLDSLLARELGKFDVKPERSYRLEAGGLVCSSFGDEFERSRGAGYIDDHAMETSGHLFAPPKVEGLPCPHRRMNLDHVGDDGNVYPVCNDCGWTAPTPCRKLSPEELQERADAAHDKDREREDRALEEALRAVGQKAVRSIIQDALERIVGAVPVQSGFVPRDAIRIPRKHARCASPSDHKVVEHRRPDLNGVQYYCRACDGAYFYSDMDRLNLRFPLTEADIRERLSR